MNAGKFWLENIRGNKKFNFLCPFFIIFILLISSDLFSLKILSISPSVTEIICELGLEKHIVGRSDFCNYPKSIKKIPAVGCMILDLEKILTLQPDICFVMKTLEPVNEHMLSRLGIRVVHLDFSSLNSIGDSCVKIRNIFGKTDKRSLFEINLECLRESKPKLKKSIYFQIWDDPFMTVSSKSFINEILILGGGRNVFSEYPSEYPTIRVESILASNPDIIIICHPITVPLERYVEDNFLIIKNYLDVKFYHVNPDIFVRPGSRIFEAVSVIKGIIEKNEN